MKIQYRLDYQRSKHVEPTIGVPMGWSDVVEMYNDVIGFYE